MLIGIWIVTMLTLLYTNEILTIILLPVKSVHTDWHMELLYKVINTSFDVYDTETTNAIKKEIDAEFDYIPVIEINMNVSKSSLAVIKIIVNISIVSTLILLKYQVFLIYTPSLYIKERKKTIIKSAYGIVVVIIAAIYTQEIWTYIYFSISLHNYNEFNFYEFDIDFDINDYINKYIIALYIHIAILNTIKKKLSVTILTFVVITGVIPLFEFIYLATILWIVIKKKRAWRYLISYNRVIIDLKKNDIIRKNGNNK